MSPHLKNFRRATKTGKRVAEIDLWSMFLMRSLIKICQKKNQYINFERGDRKLLLLRKSQRTHTDDIYFGGQVALLINKYAIRGKLF